MKREQLRNIVAALLAIAVILFALDEPTSIEDSAAVDGTAAPERQRRQSPELEDGRQARGSGVVVRILSDDNEGSRHQRFILRLASGRTLLVAHNIDLAARVANIEVGDTVEFNGEFESNSQGGVIHWTHHDPQRMHTDGWLRHKGRTYQ
ncbi:MAG: DUF3465 domain-containing protein [Woeseiaceae bacterium]